MPMLYMYVGVPYSGKSRNAKSLPLDHDDWVYISGDKFVHGYAAAHGVDYGTAFRLYGDEAYKRMNEEVNVAIRDRKNIVWDQTNLTKSTRKKKLARFPKEGYHKVAIVLPIPSIEEIDDRMAMRPEQYISLPIVNDMIDSYEVPTLGEGFDVVSILTPGDDQNE